ncbi:MAG: flavodoxin family protein [Dehalococcoidia bacterium]
MPVTVLVLYDSHGPLMESLASAVLEGIAQVNGAVSLKKHLRQARREDLLAASGIILGSPNWSGITGSLKSWLDDQGDLWEEGALAGRVGAAFAVGRGRHSGLEFTLLSLLHWMLACGMVVVGLPWSPTMRVSGSYYGATAAGEVTPTDLEQARHLGQRVGSLAVRLSSGIPPATP